MTVDRCNSYGLGRVMRNIQLISITLAFLMAICIVTVTGYCLYKINQVITQVADPDLSLFEKIVSQKVITLTKDQQRKLFPLMEELKEVKGPEKVKEIKGKMWGLLDSDQLAEVERWRQKTSNSAKAFVENSKTDARDKYKTYSRITAERLAKTLDQLYSWGQFQTGKYLGKDILKRREGN